MGLFDKSLFNQNSYKAAVGEDNKPGYAVIKLQPSIPRFGGKEDPAIKGVVSEKVSFSIEANWTELEGLSLVGDLAKGAQGVNDITSIAGITNQTSVFASNKVYRKSGYLEIKPTFRIVDWDGSGQPLISSLLLAHYCLPMNNWNGIGKDINTQVEEIKSKLNEFADDNLQRANSSNTAGQVLINGGEGLGSGLISKSIGLAQEGVKLAKKSLETVNDALVKGQEDKYAGQAAGSLGNISKIFDFYSTPSPMIVTIGNYFKHNDMVMTNVSFDFSQECTRKGPMYVDVSVSLTSRTIIGDIDGVGIYHPVHRGSNRYITIDSFGAGNATGI